MLVVAALTSASLLPLAGGEQVVRERRAGVDIDDVDTAHVDTAAVDVVDPAASLLTAPGVALARDGGPLSSSRPLLRGLSGARLAVDLAGFSLVDPAAGAVDAALLPLGIGGVDVDVGAGAGLAGELSLTPSRTSSLSLSVGSLGTVAGRGRLDVQHAAGHAVVLVDGGTTNGDFAFTRTDALGGRGEQLVRANNDQRRLQLATVVDGRGPAPAPIAGQLVTTIVGALSLHEGGVPGFATAPSTSLRAENLRGLVGGDVTLVGDDGTRFGIVVDGRGSSRRTTQLQRDERLVGHAGHVGVHAASPRLQLEALTLKNTLRLDTTSSGITAAGRTVVDRSDVGAAASIDAALPLGAFSLQLGARGALHVVTDVDHERADDSDITSMTLPNGGVRVGVGANGGVVFVGVARATRAPTLDERFAPQGFVQGNAALRPEAATDVEVGTSLRATDIVAVHATAYASQLDDAIVYVNKNAFEVAPDNTGPAQRLGLDVGVRATPVPLLRLDVVANLLGSVVAATQAPLPTAPPWTLRTALRVGDDDAFVEGIVVGRGAAPSTIFGTLPSSAYALVTLTTRVPLGDGGLALRATVDNALDVATARDANQLPLPGRLLFVGLEVRP